LSSCVDTEPAITRDVGAGAGSTGDLAGGQAGSTAGGQAGSTGGGQAGSTGSGPAGSTGGPAGTTGGQAGSTSGGQAGSTGGSTGGGQAGSPGGSTGGQAGSSGGSTGGGGRAGSTGSTDGGARDASTGGTGGGGAADAGAVPTFTELYMNYFNNTTYPSNCAGGTCHNPGKQRNLDFSTKANGYTTIKTKLVVGSAATSKVYTELQSGGMPQQRPKWSAADLAKVAAWINAGAPNN
jgi:hypothetical protein